MSGLQVFDPKTLPRIIARKPAERDIMEVVAIRFTIEQIAVMDKLANDLRISRAKFLRDFFAHMLRLPIGEDK